MPATVRPDEVVYNKANVASARSLALISSWLPSRPAAETEKSQEPMLQDDAALFTPEPELHGVGAEIPKEIADGSFRRQHLSSNKELAKMLLPKGALRAQAMDKKAPVPRPAPKKPERPAPKQDDSDDEEGRAAMFKSKRPRKSPVETRNANSDESDDEVKGKASQSRTTPERKKKRMTFLDEVLEERAKKKKK
ncbi:uncharacterized protein J3D65DRAFT_129845 [Phyllosticta citribraziliensis]|uniref:Uncharacterized protein n=1 Tax=Phyllosticta citribraziliensis TaxID=989973 RepID=A0ABR1L5S0_9PEZI